MGHLITNDAIHATTPKKWYRLLTISKLSLFDAYRPSFKLDLRLASDNIRSHNHYLDGQPK